MNDSVNARSDAPEDNLAANGATRGQQAAKGALVLLLALAGLWTLRRYVDALTWAAILAIAVWPMYRRATTRWPPGRHNILLPGLFTVAVAAVFIIPLTLVGLEVAREAHTVLDAIEQARAQGIPEPDWIAHLPLGAATVSSWWQTHLSTPESANELLKHARESAMPSGSRAVGAQAMHRLVLFGFTLMTLFF